MSLRLQDYSDRELLILLTEQCEDAPNGCVTTKDFANVLGMSNAPGHRSVGSRLSYMRRIGAVAKSQERKVQWYPTPLGMSLAKGVLPAALQGKLLQLRPEHLLLVTRAVAQRSVADSETAKVLAWREFRRESGRV